MSLRKLQYFSTYNVFQLFSMEDAPKRLGGKAMLYRDSDRTIERRIFQNMNEEFKLRLLANMPLRGKGQQATKHWWSL